MRQAPVWTAVPGLVASMALLATPGVSQDRPARVDDPTVVLTGRVVDAQTGQPLHGAFVSQNGIDGYLTHDDGSFALPVWPYGVYSLSVELLGYETLQVDLPGPETEPVVLRIRPDPIKMEELTVLVDRFESRRRRVPVAVRAWDREELLDAPGTDVVDFVMGRAGLVTRYCAANFGVVDQGQECVLRRGRFSRPAVYIDDVRAPGGLDELRSYRPQDLYTIEVYDRGRAVYAYTPYFVERVLNGRRSLRRIFYLP